MKRPTRSIAPPVPLPQLRQGQPALGLQGNMGIVHINSLSASSEHPGMTSAVILRYQLTTWRWVVFITFYPNEQKEVLPRLHRRSEERPFANALQLL